MDTAEKVRILKSKKGSTVELTRSGGEVLSALITKVHGDGEDMQITFMDVMEGVERVLSVSEIENVS
jgi:hypothetical protein